MIEISTILYITSEKYCHFILHCVTDFLPFLHYSGLPELELEAIDNQFGQPGTGDQIPWANNAVTAVNQNKPEE